MSKNRYDGILGALYGFAIGDAMGATTEFMDERQIKAKYGQVDNIIGGGWLNLQRGQVTDDTQMTMCIMDAIKISSTKFGFERSVIRNFINWYSDNPVDIGNQCAKGIRSLMCGTELHPDDNACGNGSLMRALPCALLGNLDWNITQGNLTHPSSLCTNAIMTYHKLIVDMVYGTDFQFAPYTENLMEPTGYVVNTLNNAVYWLNVGSFEDCIIGSVNNGGDSDTIAAISGSLSGARLGFSTIPEKWILGLNADVRSALETFADYAYQYYLLKSPK